MRTIQSNHQRIRSVERGSWRRGMTVVVVLGVISITLALSYAMLRAQMTSTEIQSNLDRRAAARQAAYAGVSAALRKMSDASWQGVDTPLTQDLAEEQWFEVSFETGDANLTSSAPDYAEYPFRVTIHSVGYAADLAQPDVRASYKVQAVVQLIRKKLYDEPAVWSNVRNYTTYQWSGNSSTIEFPTHVEGRSYFQGQLILSSDYPIDPASRLRYLSDLNAMRGAGLGDQRPLSGPIDTPFVKQLTAVLTLLGTNQGVALNDVGINTGAPVNHPSTTTSYKLYPGGKSYDMPVLQSLYGSTLTGVNLQPDPKLNPLGIYLSNGLITLGDNVSVQGTLMTTGSSDPDIRISGDNVSLLGQNLPALEGSTTKYQLPVALVKDDLYIFGTANASIKGLVAVWDEFAYVRADSTAKCDLKGRVVASRLNLNGRIPWDLSLLSWQSEYFNFVLQELLGGGNAIPYFPVWLQYTRALKYEPLLTISPDSAEIVHRWQVWNQPIYAPADSDDGGLRWNLVNWVDNPRVAN